MEFLRVLLNDTETLKNKSKEMLKLQPNLNFTEHNLNFYDSILHEGKWHVYGDPKKKVLDRVYRKNKTITYEWNLRLNLRSVIL